MSRTLKIILLFFMIVFTISCPQPAQAQSKQFVDYLMAEVFKRAALNDQAKAKNLEFEKVLRIYELDNNKELKKEEVFRVFNNGNGLVEELIYKDGHPQPKKPPKRGFDFGQVLPLRFDFSMESLPILENGDYFYVVRFKPKPELKNTSREDEVINRLYGEIHIDVLGLGVRKIKAFMQKSFRKYLVFSMQSFKLEVRQIEFEGILVPEIIEVEMNYSVFGLDVGEKRVYEYRNFTKKPS
jgi:hypothetical protein